jgi:hypothetical protein
VPTTAKRSAPTGNARLFSATVVVAPHSHAHGRSRAPTRDPSSDGSRSDMPRRARPCSSPISGRSASSALRRGCRRLGVALCHEVGRDAGAYSAVPKVLADRMTRDGQHALRRCRSHSLSEHQPEHADLFPGERVGRARRRPSQAPAPPGKGAAPAAATPLPGWHREEPRYARSSFRRQAAATAGRLPWLHSTDGGRPGRRSLQSR